MATDDSEFDVLLGGSNNLPATLHVSRFLACRTQEIKMMKNALAAQGGTKLAFQTLPYHMRRRVMSHNAKRLPRRLREIHLNQMRKSGLPAQQKRPSRKFRRRPRNLLEEYTKRSKRYKWLETHIWHAKRFHMVTKWGYKLPQSPCDKAFRACYRAVTKHCLLQDVSYIRCIELSGTTQEITEKLKAVSKTKTGLSVGAKCYQAGAREGSATLYNEGTPLGSFTFLWDSTNTKLWVWVHNAFYQAVESFLRQIFTSSTSVRGLPNLNRFSLTGPLSTQVLEEAFVITQKVPPKQKLLQDFVTNHQAHIEQTFELWRDLNGVDTAEVSPHSVISLLIQDPRLNLPKARTPARLAPLIVKKNCDVPAPLPVSALWFDDLRTEVEELKFSDMEIADLQGTLLVPGSQLAEAELVPVILVQRPGAQDNLGLGSGWDIILPTAFARPIWQGLIMRGARTGGLRESESIRFEMGLSQFLKPDTPAGQREDAEISQKSIETFFRRPPNKRTNYNKFNIVTPLKFNWELLLQDWSSDSFTSFNVVRDGRTLSQINEFLRGGCLPELPENCLIPVKIECEKRGALARFAIICLPASDGDLKGSLEEPKTVDNYQKARRDLRDMHIKLLKRVRRLRKKNLNIPSADVDELKAYTTKIRGLWLPEATTIRNSCSREIIGQVEKGGFSYSKACSFATGYIVSKSLQSLAKLRFRNKILYRNNNSKQYRVGRMSAIE